jgi:uncharacterized membrane protein YsdA (DUF1294 family)
MFDRSLMIFDSVAIILFVALNVCTFIAFGLDKWRAMHSGRRVPELTLLLLAALGGWPGGLLGMFIFRHKSAKRSFITKYLLVLAPFAAGLWAWLRWG